MAAKLRAVASSRNRVGQRDSIVDADQSGTLPIRTKSQIRIEKDTAYANLLPRLVFAHWQGRKLTGFAAT